MNDDLVKQEIKTYLEDFTITITNQRTWMSLFGVPLDAVPVIWFFVDLTKSKIKHLLWVFHYLKTYPTIDCGAVFWKVSIKNYELWIWNMLENLFCNLKTVSHLIKKDKIKFSKIL
jgi:hypothetical protein